MPDLLTFIACEKVIVDKEDESISIYNLLQRVVLSIPDGIQPSGIREFPLSWGILTLWRNPGEEIGIKYQQRIELNSPSGEPFIYSETDWAFGPVEANNRIIVKLDIFPVAPEGVWRLRLFLRETEPMTSWMPIAEYPIELGFLK